MSYPCDCASCETKRLGAAPWLGKLSRKALNEAKMRLGIKGEVIIRRGSCEGVDEVLRREGWAYPPSEPDTIVSGSHAMRRDGTHIVEIHKNLGAAQANRALFHELTHAAQTEAHGLDAFQRIYGLADLMFGYDCNPYELEAEENAKTLGVSLKVVVA